MENPIIFTAEIIGTIAFASSGAMLGIRKNLDLFGVLVLGLCVAVGGGIVRDIILGRTPPGAFRDPVYALVALGTSTLLFLLVYGKQEIMKQVFPLDEKMMLRRMSKGMQKQAAFWLTMSMCPKVLVLDEPVDGLDPVMRRQVWSIIMADVAENGTTVLVSSHNLRELEDICDHVGIMNKGKLLLERSLSELQENIAKVQLALPDGSVLPEGLNILHQSSTGRLQTLIIRGVTEEITNTLATCEPLFMDVIPLSLEEIFIYELGGEHYEVKNVIL